MTVGLDLEGDFGVPLAEARVFYQKYEPRPKLLGRGLSSVVKLCVEKNTGVEFAVKIIDCNAIKATHDGAELLRSVEQEVVLLAELAGHANIIDLHDSFCTRSFMFLVFELCRGGELFDYMNEKVTLPLRQTRCFMSQVLTAVEFVHEHKICHRDIKSENILLDSNLNIKLADFGFAVKLAPDEKLRELVGTPSYLAPETLAASMYDVAPGYSFEVDLWACGVTMYTLLVGFPPFWHRTQIRMLRMIMNGDYSFAHPEWQDVPPEAKDLISRLLTVDPAQRISATDALAHPFLRYRIFQPTVVQLKKKFKAAVYVLMATRFIMTAGTRTPSLSLLQSDPYRERAFRRLVDGCAFQVYGHWVKRHDVQNRAAMFEIVQKRSAVEVEPVN